MTYQLNSPLLVKSLSVLIYYTFYLSQGRLRTSLLNAPYAMGLFSLWSFFGL